MTTRELPAAATLATIVRTGPLDQSHLAFGALGHLDGGERLPASPGPCREVFLEPACSQSADRRHA